MSLEGKIAIVTGASSGIGESIALLFAERKASVVLCGRSESRLEKAVQKCQEVSGNSDRFIFLAGDVSDREVRSRIIQSTVDNFGQIDILIPNAGIMLTPFPTLETTEEMYDEVMDVNNKSVFFLIKEAIPWLEKSRGSVVCVSSILAHVACKMPVYSMSKASLDHMCRCLAIELGPKGIRVNTVNPTFVKTRIMRTLFPAMAESDDLSSNDLVLASKGPAHPLGGRCALPEEVASAVAFLACDEASFVTGESINVDGGVSLTCAALQ